MLQFAQFGAGRIGASHAANLAAHPRAALVLAEAAILSLRGNRPVKAAECR